MKDLAQTIGLPAIQPSLAGGTDFAYGGAETGQTPVHTLSYDHLAAQVLAVPHAGSIAAQPGSAVRPYWIGANDVLDIANDASLTPDQQRQTSQRR